MNTAHILRGITRATILLIGLTALQACSSNEDSPLPAQVTLRYVSQSDNKLTFELQNGTSETLSFRGLRGLMRVRPLAGVTSELECRKTSTERWWPEAKIEEAAPEIVQVAPQQRLQLEVDGNYTREYKGGLCHLKMRLQSGASIESSTFAP